MGSNPTGSAKSMPTGQDACGRKPTEQDAADRRERMNGCAAIRVAGYRYDFDVIVLVYDLKVLTPFVYDVRNKIFVMTWLKVWFLHAGVAQW